MLSPRIAARGRCVTDKSDSVRLSDEQRLDWLLLKHVALERLSRHFNNLRFAAP
jgi:hypothetical protein